MIIIWVFSMGDLVIYFLVVLFVLEVGFIESDERVRLGFSFIGDF